MKGSPTNNNNNNNNNNSNRLAKVGKLERTTSLFHDEGFESNASLDSFLCKVT